MKNQSIKRTLRKLFINNTILYILYFKIGKNPYEPRKNNQNKETTLR